MPAPRKGNTIDYDRMLLETLDPETKFYQFGVKKPLPTGEGSSILWNRPRRLGFGQKIAAGLKPSANALSTIRVSTIIEVYGGYTALDEQVVLTSVSDVLDVATSELAKQAAETINIIPVVYKLFLNIVELLFMPLQVSKRYAMLPVYE